MFSFITFAAFSLGGVYFNYFDKIRSKKTTVELTIVLNHL